MMRLFFFLGQLWFSTGLLLLDTMEEVWALEPDLSLAV
jgi:hypothetical protein